MYSPLNVPQTGGGLRLTGRDLLKIAELYRAGGGWNGSGSSPTSWVKASTTPHARIDDDTEYGYLWWLKKFKSGEKSHAAFFMSGNGGNKVMVFPDLDNECGADEHELTTPRVCIEQTEQLLTDYILQAVEQ